MHYTSWFIWGYVLATINFPFPYTIWFFWGYALATNNFRFLHALH